MESNELRKGNLVKWDGKIAAVSQILWDRVEVEVKTESAPTYHECSYDEIEPIPVTKEILEQCDLIKHRRFYYANVYYSKTGKFIINQLRDNIEISFAVNSTPGIISDKKLSLHQLQNMYFAMLQQELVINL